MRSSPSGVVEIEVSQYNVVSRSVLERKMEQGKDVSCVRMNWEAIRKGSNGRLGANWPVNVVDHNISNTIYGTPETQKTVIRARKIPGPGARVDALVDEKTDSKIGDR